MAHEYPARNFDIVIGVSSGACAAVYYVTEPPGDSLAIHRFLQVWRFELNGSKLMSYLNLLRGRQFLDQNYLIDELFTPDSSRFWPVASYKLGTSPQSFDKQYVRDYLETLDWDKKPPGPRLPSVVIERTHEKYYEAFDRLT